MTREQALAQLRREIAFHNERWQDIVDHHRANWARIYRYTFAEALQHARTAHELGRAHNQLMHGYAE